jgi:hypothetical protein
MKKPDLLILVAIWEFISAFFLFISMCFMYLAYFISIPWWMGGMGAHVWEDALGSWTSLGPIEGFVMGFLGLIILAFLILSLLGGIGLLRGREWGRILSIIQAALSLLWLPIGTVVGILILIYLVRTEVRDYFAAGGTGVTPTT